MEFLHLELTPQSSGSIHIETYPPSEVYLENDFIGTSPLFVEVDGNNHLLAVTRPGFVYQSQSIITQSFRVTRLYLRLEPAHPNMIFWNDLAGFEVLIDGKPYSEGYAVLSRGTHQFSLQRPDRGIDFELDIPSGVFELNMLSRSLLPY